MPDYKGPDRRTFCESHNRQLDDINELQQKTASMRGWQKALSFFMALCFVCVVGFAQSSNAKTEKVHDGFSKIDKQLAVVTKMLEESIKRQNEINEDNKRRLERLEDEKN